MVRFLAKRLGLTLLTLVLVSMIVFASAQVLPGDIGRTILGQFATPAQVLALDHQLGADQPLVPRYLHWFGKFIRGDWGHSYLQNVAVAGLVLGRFANSMYLGMFALLLTVPFSIFFGVLAALRKGGVIDRLITVTGLSLIALPEFVTGVILIVAFSIKLKWLPVNSTVPSANPASWFRQFLLPSLPLVMLLFGYISRMARAGTVEALSSNYTRTAILKGLPRRTVIFRHVLRNAMVPTVTVIAVQTGYLVGGLVVIETLFNYPGLGKLIYDSAIGHDIPVLEATVLLVSLVLLVANLGADLLYVALNPRLRVRGRE